jgi:AcrR family transcriptional regulator
MTEESSNIVKIDGKDRRPWSVTSRETLLRAAIAEIADRGYEHARLVDIAARADMTVGAIYNWFDNKSKLFKAALEFALENQHAQNLQYLSTDKVQSATGFQSNHWLILIAALVPRHGNDSGPTEAQLILLESLRSAWRDEDSKKDLQAQVVSLLAQYETIIMRAMDDGLIDKSLNPALIARVFMAFPTGMSSLSLAGAPDIAVQEYIPLLSRLNEAMLPKNHE